MYVDIRQLDLVPTYMDCPQVGRNCTIKLRTINTPYIAGSLRGGIRYVHSTTPSEILGGKSMLLLGWCTLLINP